MADCLITKSRALPCKDAQGGIKSIMFANFDDYGFTTSGGTISGLGTLDVVYKYAVKLASSTNTFQQDVQSAPEAGTTAFQQVLNVALPKLSADIANELKLMAYGRPIIFIELTDGTVLLMGKEGGSDITGGTLVSGGVMADMQGFTATFTAMERDNVGFLSPTAITALKALISED